MFDKLQDWLALRDYDNAKKAAAKKIVKRQSRGNVFSQNGWFINHFDFRKKSLKADEDLRVIECMLKHAS